MVVVVLGVVVGTAVVVGAAVVVVAAVVVGAAVVVVAAVVVGAAGGVGAFVVVGPTVDVGAAESGPLPQAKARSITARYMAITLMVLVCHPPLEGAWRCKSP